jgi:DNA-binding CsgD family transcriptional regulator/PAS domain-containing protein
VTLSDERVSSAIDAFQAAALGSGSWLEALEALASVTASRSGQLIGVGDDAAVPFNWVTNLDPQALVEFVAMNGGDPSLNARVRAGMAAPELEVLTEADFLAPGDAEGEIYSLYRRYDVPHTCQTTLIREPGLHVGLTVMRAARQGQVTAEEQRAFAAIAPHARAAVRTQMTLQTQGAALVAGAMEALSMAVFVCDAQGLVRAMSPRAEALVRSQRHLRLKNDRLLAWSNRDTHALTLALHQAAFARSLGARPPAMLLLHDPQGAEPLLAEVATVPGERHSFGFGVAALLLVREPRDNDVRGAALARSMFKLTQAETAVVADLVAGLGPQAIADRANVSVGTIRSHIRRIFDKAGVRSQVELLSLITARL